jgi:5-methyltetrahydropteroyltriglutamate--homocysteine methyltransferase
MGADRELKKANEAYWGDKLSREELLKEGKRLRLEHWKIQKDAGVDIIPSNDFAFYDHLLDHIQLFNVSTHSHQHTNFTNIATGYPRALLQEQSPHSR